jgi:hypothetical protein
MSRTGRRIEREVNGNDGAIRIRRGDFRRQPTRDRRAAG